MLKCIDVHLQLSLIDVYITLRSVIHNEIVTYRRIIKGWTLKGLNYIYSLIDDAFFFNQSNEKIVSIPFHTYFLCFGDFDLK